MFPADTDWLYSLLVHSQGSRWRYRSSTPSPAAFAADLWNGVHAQFVVIDAELNPCGIVGLYNANYRASHCHLFAVGEPDRGTQVTEATGLLIDWAFAEFDFDKIWIECPEFNLEQFATLRKVAQVEGRLTNHDYWRERFWDLYVLSLDRVTWTATMSPLVRARRHDPEPGTPSTDRPALGATLVELWPLDSLGRVELLCQIEDTIGCTVDMDLLDGLAELEIDAALRVLMGRVDSLCPSP